MGTARNEHEVFRKSHMRQVYFIAGLILGVAITIFALQNTTGAELRFLFWQADGPLALVVILSAVGGALVALLFAIPGIVQDRWRIRALERRLGEAAKPPEVPKPPADRREEGSPH
jgi:uncharacterized integral membrane protein